MSHDVYTPAVCDILDLYYDRDGAEPDWSAVQTRLISEVGSSYTLTLNLLQALFSVYEDTAAWETQALYIKVLRESE